MRTITLTAEQMTCLASPARNEVFMQIRTLGRASVGEIAKAVGKKPEAVHYHVKALVSAGLAREAGRRHRAKKPEAIYETVGKRLRLPRPDSGPEVSKLIRKSVAAGLRQAARGYLEASEKSDEDPELRKMMHTIRMNIRLSPKDAKELLRRIEELVQFADTHLQEDGLRLVWSSIVYPAKRP